MSGEQFKLASAALIVFSMILAADLVYLRPQKAPYLNSQYFEDESVPQKSEVELNWVSEKGYHATVRIDLANKTWFYSGATDDANSYDQSPMLPLGASQIDQIQKLLPSLPWVNNQSFWSQDEYKKEYHVAFYSGGKLVRFHYPKANPPSGISELLKFLKIEDFYK